MAITYTCPECSAELDSSASVADATVTCPKCALQVPMLDRRIGAGTRIGGFEIRELIGKGAMGEVYLARQVSMDRDVALKILAPQVAGHGYAVQRFLKEIRMSAQVEHPNVVRAYEAGEDQGVYYLAMAYVKGESLAARLKRVGRYTESEALTLGRKMADALNQTWKRQGLLHRDIKPANILISDRGEPLLADLGLAKRQNESDQGLTQTGSVLGTPSYMSPEQIDGRKTIDTRSDMYGLGTTLYHAVTGRIPFAGSTLVETLKKQATETLEDPRLANESLSEGFVQILVRMLAKDPEDRYPDWESLIADIDHVREGQNSGLPDLGTGQSVVVREGAAWVETIRVTPTANVHSAEVTVRRPRARRSGYLLAGVGALIAFGGGIWWAMHRGNGSSGPADPTAGLRFQAGTDPIPVPPPDASSILSMEEIGRVLDQASEKLLALDGPAVRAHIASVKEQIPPGQPLPPQIEGMERIAIMINELGDVLHSADGQKRLQASEMPEASLILGILLYQEGKSDEALRIFAASPSQVGTALIRRIATRNPPGQGPNDPLPSDALQPPAHLDP